MKIFLSWSVQGSQSHQVAEVLRDWLPNVIQQVKPWLSSQDIKTGTRWQAELNKELKDTRFGIFSITHESKDRPYLMFEAGALSRYVEEISYVCPYYFGLKPTDVKNPISEYMGSEATKEGTLDLLRAINSALPEDNLPGDSLEKSFNMWWPELECRFESIRNNEPIESIQESNNARSDREILEELLMIARVNEQTSRVSNPGSTKAKIPFEYMGAEMLVSEEGLLLEYESIVTRLKRLGLNKMQLKKSGDLEGLANVDLEISRLEMDYNAINFALIDNDINKYSGQ